MLYHAYKNYFYLPNFKNIPDFFYLINFTSREFRDILFHNEMKSVREDRIASKSYPDYFKVHNIEFLIPKVAHTITYSSRSVRNAG